MMNKIKVVCIESDSESWISGKIYEAEERFFRVNDKKIMYYSFD